MNKDRGLRALTTKLCLVRPKDRNLDTLNAQLEIFLKLERDENRNKIKELERENASLKSNSSAAENHTCTQPPIGPEFVAELEAKIYVFQKESAKSRARERKDVVEILKLTERSIIFEKFPGGYPDMEKTVNTLEKRYQKDSTIIFELEEQLFKSKSKLTKSDDSVKTFETER